MPRMDERWRFWIDVGGTFTDCIALSPDGQIFDVKVTSSALVRGRIAVGSSASCILDPERCGEPDGFYAGYELIVTDASGACVDRAKVETSEGRFGRLSPCRRLLEFERATSYELRSPEEAPILAIRRVLGARLCDPLPELDLVLGTTLGTNALLERRGARTALVATAGLADALAIGYQARPELFALAIEKTPPLWERVVEIDERTDARGNVVIPLDEPRVRAALESVRATGIESLAICFVNSYTAPRQELRVEEIAREIGFRWVACSSMAAAVPRFVPRGDTAVVDAYLGPVIEDYVRRLAPEGSAIRLSLLTSAGGLVPPASFRGSDSILSGPAGGVVAVAHVAKRQERGPVIGLDMGGTSTDVCRFAVRFEIESEGEKAGVRVSVPRLSIETVAAGGGSICDFDGERLTVGPRSAGASPGPACYGAGGPLTLTDVNLWLGRVLEDRFPFPLDRAAVARRLEELSARLRSSGYVRSCEEIAFGLLEIATARLVGAIRRVSVAKGHDVRDHALVAFGGAGGQHACTVASALGMSEIIVPRRAGYFSAFGAGLAEPRATAGRVISAVLSDSIHPWLGQLAITLEAEARERLESRGEMAATIRVDRCVASARYVGQDSSIPIDAGGVAAEIRARFEAEHRRAFGYTHARRDVEIVALRVDCVVPRRDSIGVEATTPRSVAEIEDPPPRTVWFDGGPLMTRVLSDEAVPALAALEGPLVILSSGHTTVVEPGWTVRRAASGDLLLSRGRDASSVGGASSDGAEGSLVPLRADPTNGDEARVDPVSLEIFHQHFAAIADEMGQVLRRSALSTNVRERLDYSCAVFDARGRIVANAPHIPVHLGSMGMCVELLLEDVGELRDGDVLATNDPYRGGSHLPDVTVVRPVFVCDDARPAFFVASRAHHAEIGGRRPGSMPPDSRTLDEEGVIIRRLRIVEAGVPRIDELVEVLESGPFPSRAPAENVADIEAQIAACATGARRLLDLVARVGRAAVDAHTRSIQNASRRLVERALRRLPAGSVTFADALDDGTPVAVTIETHDGHADFDFGESGGVHPGNFNATPAIVTSAVLYCLRVLIDVDIPLNAGVLDAVRIRVAPGLLDPASAGVTPAPAVAAGNVETSQRLVDVIFGALGIVAASQGTMNNLIFGNDRFGYYETIAGGAGAGPGFDGADAVHTHMTNTRLTDVETLEARYPVRVRRFGIRRGSGGAGRWRGGDGVVREIEFLEPLSVSIISSRRTTRPYGLHGGAPGAAGRNVLVRGGIEIELASSSSFDALAGDVLRIETPGGGAYGGAGAHRPIAGEPSD
jgi:5-oxoprolinase (ATP-hydrolysing)